IAPFDYETIAAGQRRFDGEPPAGPRPVFDIHLAGVDAVAVPADDEVVVVERGCRPPLENETIAHLAAQLYGLRAARRRHADDAMLENLPAAAPFPGIRFRGRGLAQWPMFALQGSVLFANQAGNGEGIVRRGPCSLY